MRARACLPRGVPLERAQARSRSCVLSTHRPPLAKVFAVGAGVLFPWNAIITAVDYFASLYPGRNVESVFSVCYMLPNFALLVACTFLARAPTSHARVAFGFGIFLLVMIAMPLATGGAGDAGFGVAALLVALTGVGDGTCQGAVYALAGPLPPRYTQALTGGTSVAGFVISVLRLCTKAAYEDTQEGLRRSALLYFGLAGCWVALCIALYGRMVRLPIVAHYRALAARGTVDVELAWEGVVDGGEGGDALFDNPVAAADGHTYARDGVADGGGRLGTESDAALLAGAGASSSAATTDGGGAGGKSQVDESVDLQEGGVSGFPSVGHGARMRRLPRAATLGAAHERAAARAREFAQAWAIAWPEAASICFPYMVTLSMFPAFFAVSGVKSEALGDWYAVLCIALWNLGDLGAKLLLGVERLHIRERRTGWMLAASRATFWPAFSVAVHAGAGEAIVCTLSLLLGATNGYVGGGILMLAPQLAPPHMKEAVGNLAVLALVLGLVVGGWLSFLWDA